MAEISVDFRNISDAKKCAVSSPRLVSLEIEAESPGCENESDVNGYFLNHQVSFSDIKNDAEVVESGVGNINSMKLIANDKTKVISNVDVSGSLSDLLSSIAQETLIKDDVHRAIDSRRQKNTQVSGIQLLDFDFDTNENMKDPLLSNNSTLKVEGNLSDLLSLINIGDSDGTIAANCNSSNMCESKNVNKLKTVNQPKVPNLSDLLSSIDLGETNNVSCYQTDMKIVETKNDSCLADLLQSVEIDEPVLNNNPSSFDSTNSFSKSTTGISDSLKDSAFDLSDSSYASSLSETDDNSPQNSMKNILTNKALESDSTYGSLDSAPKGFSFFDYSSDNQFSFNTLLTDNSAVNKATKLNHEDAENVVEEMSMSDLLTIVSPDFKIPIFTTFNKNQKPNSSLNDSNMLDLIESLNNNSKNSDSHDINNGNLMNFDCVDGRTSKKTQSGMETVNCPVIESLEKDIFIDGNDIASNGENVTIAEDETPFIDLRECIKSTKHKFIPKSPIKQIKSIEKQSLEFVSPPKIKLHCEEKPLDLLQNSLNQFNFNDRIPIKKSRVNSKQTMFSKALACKPKKDQSLLQKVASIKNDLLHIINPPVLIDCDVPEPIIELVLQSDKCIVSNMDRKSFGTYEAYELLN